MKTVNTTIEPKQSDKFEVGAILEDSWGYEQTNVDFYCIIARKDLWLTVMPMTKIETAQAISMTGTVRPDKIKQGEKPQRKKLRVWSCKETGIRFRNYSGGGWCSLWNGKDQYVSHYA